MDTRSPRQTFSSVDELREVVGQPMELAAVKSIDHLDKYCKAFIARAPFLCIGTAAANGRADVSPRGDGPGFVQVLDDNTLFIPERPGNKRVDSLGNIVENTNVGIIFLVPGYEETLRINGRARVIVDDALLEDATVKGKKPKIGIEVTVDEAFLHCAKAIKRSKLWDASRHCERGELPSLAQMVMEQVAPPDDPPSKDAIDAADEFVEDNYRNELY